MTDLTKMFNPDSVAIVGASNSEGKVGYIIVNNMINDGFKGNIYPINPKDDEIQGLKAYKNVSDLPEVPDLVIISIPSVLVNPVVEECGEFGVKNMVVITAGFKEIGGEGVERENELVALGKKYGIKNHASYRKYCIYFPKWSYDGGYYRLECNFWNWIQ